MLTQVLVTLVLAAGMAPCVLQRACPRRPPPPPSTVCMHRLHPQQRRRYVRSYISQAEAVRARVSLPALLRVSLAALLLLLPLRLPQDRRVMATALCLALALVAVRQVPVVVGECKNCINLGKEEKAMFRAHSEACLAESRVDPGVVEELLRGRLSDGRLSDGRLADGPALKRHVYCVLLRCKLIGKDGKMQKAAVLGKLAARADGRNVTKVLESCADQHGESPEELAWNLFRCGYDKRAALFDRMPPAARSARAARPAPAAPAARDG